MSPPSRSPGSADAAHLLKVRYADAPVFMDVAAVISSYAVEGEISLSGQYAPIGRGDAFGNVGATGRYADKPTITYQPLIGDKFARSMMAPIPVTGILFLLQSGYPADSCCASASTRSTASRTPMAVAAPARWQSEVSRADDGHAESQAEGGMGFRVKATRTSRSS